MPPKHEPPPDGSPGSPGPITVGVPDTIEILEAELADTKDFDRRYEARGYLGAGGMGVVRRRAEGPPPRRARRGERVDEVRARGARARPARAFCDSSRL